MGAEIENFSELATPKALFSILVVLGTVAGAWGLKPPVKKE